MTLIVEDGTGKADAESYCTLAAANARHTALGNTAWTGSDATKEAALRRATQFMLGRYRTRWQGERAYRTQALDWPRICVTVERYPVESTIVPTDIANACADLALRALTETLSEDLERVIVREKVGPLETEYSPYSPQAKRFVAIDNMLAPYLVSANRVIRA